MNTRSGRSHHGEAHGRTITTHAWTAPAGTDPGALLAEVEAATGLRLASAAPGQEVHGYVNTTAYPDRVEVEVHLYGFSCGPSCPHCGGTFKKAPDVADKIGRAARERGEA